VPGLDPYRIGTGFVSYSLTLRAMYSTFSSPHASNIELLASWALFGHESLSIFVHCVPNLLSVLDPTSLASGIAAVHIDARKQCRLLAKRNLTLLLKKSQVSFSSMCPGEDLNLHELPRLLLRQVRLPISPPGQGLVQRVYHILSTNNTF
jgi:hypothetical protein